MNALIILQWTCKVRHYLTTSISVLEWPMLHTIQPFLMRSSWSLVTTFLFPAGEKHTRHPGSPSLPPGRASARSRKTTPRTWRETTWGTTKESLMRTYQFTRASKKDHNGWQNQVESYLPLPPAVCTHVDSSVGHHNQDSWNRRAVCVVGQSRQAYLCK